MCACAYTHGVCLRVCKLCTEMSVACKKQKTKQKTLHPAAHSCISALYFRLVRKQTKWFSNVNGVDGEHRQGAPWEIRGLEGGSRNWLSHTVYKDDFATTGRLLRSLVAGVFLVKLYNSITFSHSPWVLLTKWWVLFLIRLMVVFRHFCKCRLARCINLASQTSCLAPTCIASWAHALTPIKCKLCMI